MIVNLTTFRKLKTRSRKYNTLFFGFYTKIHLKIMLKILIRITYKLIDFVLFPIKHKEIFFIYIHSLQLSLKKNIKNEARGTDFTNFMEKKQVK